MLARDDHGLNRAERDETQTDENPHQGMENFHRAGAFAGLAQQTERRVDGKKTAHGHQQQKSESRAGREKTARQRENEKRSGDPKKELFALFHRAAPLPMRFDLK